MNKFLNIYSIYRRTSSVNAKLTSSESVEEITPNDLIPNQSQIRNRYLTKIGVEDHTDDDLDPLLN